MRPSKAVQDSVRAYRRALPWALLLLPALVGGQAYRWDAEAREVFPVHEAEVKAEIAKIRARDVRRPPLLDPPRPGDAWECYASALDTIRKMPRTKLSGNPLPPATERALLLSAYSPILDLLEEAQRRGEVDIPWEYEKGRTADYRNLGVSSTLSWDLGRIARALYASGEDARALNLLVTLLGALSDFRRGTDECVAGWTLQCEPQAIDLCRQILSGHALAGSDLAALAGRIDRLAASRPDFHDTIAREVVLQRQVVLLEEAADPTLLGWEMSAWRQGFSRRVARAASLRGLRAMGGELSELRNRPQGEWKRSAYRIAELPRFRVAGRVLNPVAYKYGLEVRARTLLELLRAAVAAARYREETGEEAADPEVLVPQYLPAVPVSPETGETLLCRKGWVGFHEDARQGWTVRRRSEAAPAALR